MDDVQLTRRQALCAGAVTAAGALTLRAGAASAEGDGLELLVEVERAPQASRNVYELALGGFHHRTGRRSTDLPAAGPTSEWGDTTLAFRLPSERANQEVHDWVTGVRRGRRDERSVLVTAVRPQGGSSHYRLEGCRPVAFAELGFENGIGLVQVLTVAVGRVVSEG